MRPLDDKPSRKYFAGPLAGEHRNARHRLDLLLAHAEPRRPARRPGSTGTW
jgi:hypothetical protein